MLHTKMVQYRAVEFIICFIVIAFSYILDVFGLFQRDIPKIEIPINETTSIYVRDPSINLLQKHEQVDIYLLQVLSFGVPLLAHGFVALLMPSFGFGQRIQYDTRDFLLSAAVSTAIASLFTNFIKNLTGRFRPCFYDMCQWDSEKAWDGQTNLCTSRKWEAQGRKSFPSGHASRAFAELFLLSLYLLGRSKVVQHVPTASNVQQVFASIKLFICFLPTLLATWIAITRNNDNWHHPTDITVGSLIGILSSSLGYMYNYSSIFDSKFSGLPRETVLAKYKEGGIAMLSSPNTQQPSSNAINVDSSQHYSHD